MENNNNEPQQRRAAGGQTSNGDNNGNSQQQQQSQAQTTPGEVPYFAKAIGSYVMSHGIKEKATTALNIYSHIDFLRPYFDVEPRDVLNRLMYSMVPFHPPSSQVLEKELYGPVMILFTLCYIIIYQMKVAMHTIQDGTLIGTAFFLTFSYWLGTAGLLSSASFVCNSSLGLVNYLSLIGYSLFSHCVVLLIGTFVHTSFDNSLFYFMWLVLSGAAALRVAYIIYENTTHPSYRIGLGVAAGILHMLFLLYIHFSYHVLAEVINHAILDGPSSTNLPFRQDVLDKPSVRPPAIHKPDRN